MQNSIFCLMILVFCQISQHSAQTLNWSGEQIIQMNTSGSTTRPRLLALGSQKGILIWGHEQNQSIQYALWENDLLDAPQTLDIGTRKAFITSWASTEIAGQDNMVYIVFKEDPAEMGKIYLLRSNDYGKTFTPPIPVVDPQGFYCRFPGVAMDANQQPIVSYMRFKTDWSEPAYVSIRSNDFGDTFDPYTEVTDKTKGEACDCCPVSMETDADRIAVFYRNNRNNIRNMTAAVSLNNGKSYDITAELDTADWLLHSCPSTGGDGFFADSFLHTTWTTGRTGSTKAFYSRLNLNTQNVDGFFALTHQQGRNLQQSYPRMSGFKDTVGIVWGELVSNMDIFFSHFTDGAFSNLSINTQRINSVTNGHQSSPDIAFANSSFYACWQDLNDNSIKFKIGKYQIPNRNTNIETESGLNIQKSSDSYLITSKTEIKNWTLFDSNGQVLMNGHMAKEILLKYPKYGIYFLQLQHKAGIWLVKIII
ncbi:MAG: T9SS type A sorting domain-containing protein [Saprospiraceae bacterium]|nr:T9SS type A sorting domain-containing protein [Saprospiraceae bacterium]